VGKRLFSYRGVEPLAVFVSGKARCVVLSGQA
jgi:hypothetical protein